MRKVKAEMGKLKDNTLRWGLRNVAAGGLAAGGLAAGGLTVGLVTGHVGGLVMGGIVVGGLVVGLRQVMAELNGVAGMECATSVITADDQT